MKQKFLFEMAKACSQNEFTNCSFPALPCHVSHLSRDINMNEWVWPLLVLNYVTLMQ